jgi:hypothetical protein
MPIIIYGTRGLTSHLQSGEFYCPGCQAKGDFQLKQVRRWFTLFFIPIFPVSGPQRYVECQHCRGNFHEEVLELKEPSPEERFLSKMYDQLLRGSSLESVKKRMIEADFDQREAEQILHQMTKGKTWGCVSCGKRYLTKFKRCPTCEA